MNLSLVARNTELDDATREFVERQLEKVTRFLEEPIDVRCRLAAEKHRRIADLHIGHRFGVIQAADETGDLREAVRLAVEKAEKQARRARQKHKEKKRRTRRPVVGEWPLEVLDPTTLEATDGPTVIESKTFSVHRLSFEEALEKMEEIGLGFYVYRQQESGRVVVIYRRRDDTLGLLSPEL